MFSWSPAFSVMRAIVLCVMGLTPVAASAVQAPENAPTETAPEAQTPPPSPESDEAPQEAESTQVPADEVFPPGTPTREERLHLDPVEGSLGIYGREGAETRVELYPCAENSLCGRIVWLRRLAEPDGSVRRDLKNPEPELRMRPLIGLEVLWGLQGRDGTGRVWNRGRIYNPDDGNDYKARVEFREDNSIELKACIFIVCETQIWMHHGDPVGSTAPGTTDATPEEEPQGETLPADAGMMDGVDAEGQRGPEEPAERESPTSPDT